MAEQLADFLQRLKEHPCPQPYVISRGVLPVAGKMIIAGQPKSNKSFVVLNLLFDLAMGRNAFNATYRNGVPVLPIHKPWRVLLMEQEMGDQGLFERLDGKDGKLGIASEMEELEKLGVFIKTRDTAMRLDTPEGREFIFKEVESVRPDVLFLDPLAKFHLSDENSAQETSALIRVVDHLIEGFGCSVCIIHHTAKDNMDNPRRGGNRIRGSSALFGDIDTFCEVVRISSEQTAEPTLRLSFELRRGEPIEPLLIRRLRDGKIIYIADAPPEEKERDQDWSNKKYRKL